MTRIQNVQEMTALEMSLLTKPISNVGIKKIAEKIKNQENKPFAIKR